MSKLSDRNRRLMSVRGRRWPDGAVEACERLERSAGGDLVVWWHHEWTVPGFECKEGFYAWPASAPAGTMDYRYDLPGGRWIRRHEVYGATIEELKRSLR
ncbi:hypothetical protein [Actinoplanes solisilvae]|uniref:hypothetical protein n=1 Tax=Actinoplanes solisilvae TaxID=2486853 RepID=UPI000FD88D4E|nr:hypothetical protein [Actinoplanes solisilvae]